MWDVFKDWIFDIIHFFYDFCGDWGLAIIIVTVIFRILISSTLTISLACRKRCRSSTPR